MRGVAGTNRGGWKIFEQRDYRPIRHSGAWLASHATIQRYPDFTLQ
jgi:hypothetical protein